jgi:RNA polymerase primary sigma factor
MLHQSRLRRTPVSSKKKAEKDGDDSLQTYFGQIKNIPLLSFEEELELSKRIQQGDEMAKTRLIEANLRLVIKIARMYLTSDVSFMDLIQEGNIGLMRAAEKYDHARNVRFSTYAAWWIRQSIARFLANRRRAIRLPHRKEESLRKIRNAYHALTQTLTRQPTTGEIALYVGMDVSDVAYILNITNNMVSLETDVRDAESTTIADLHEDYTYSPERELMRKANRDVTLHFLNRLKDREKRILMYRYQMNGTEHHTLKTIGAEMGISPETVRQIEMRAMKKMRANAAELRDSVY